jgi:hypothetical protein
MVALEELAHFAVVGSMIVLTSEMELAGNPPISACFLTVSLSGAM